MLPVMMVRMSSVMCWSGQSHQASVGRQVMSLSPSALGCQPAKVPITGNENAGWCPAFGLPVLGE